MVVSFAFILMMQASGAMNTASALPPPPPSQPIPLDPKPVARVSLGMSGDDYPIESIRNGEQGTSHLSFTVGVDGRVHNCAAYGATPKLDSRACEVAQERWLFLPATKNEKPIEAVMRQNIRWVLPYVSIATGLSPKNIEIQDHPIDSIETDIYYILEDGTVTDCTGGDEKIFPDGFAQPDSEYVIDNTDKYFRCVGNVNFKPYLDKDKKQVIKKITRTITIKIENVISSEYLKINKLKITSPAN